LGKKHFRKWIDFPTLEPLLAREFRVLLKNPVIMCWRWKLLQGKEQVIEQAELLSKMPPVLYDV
jgi:hypothetical protein